MALRLPHLLWLLCALLLAGCPATGEGAGRARADDVQDNATTAMVDAAEARARAAEGGMSRADAAAKQARADALHSAAVAEDQRQAKLRAEERAAAITADRARLGWWATLAGMALLVVAAGASALGWYYGLGNLSHGLGVACAAGGGAALALGLSWGWLPILVACLVLGGALLQLLRRAAAHIDAHAERSDLPPDKAKALSAAEQVRAGTWQAVQRLRGKPLDRAKLRRLLPVPAR